MIKLDSENSIVWDSVCDSVNDSVWNCVYLNFFYDSIWDSVRKPVWIIVGNFVAKGIRRSVRYLIQND